VGSSLSDRIARLEKLIATAKKDAAPPAPLPAVDPELEGLFKADYPSGSIYVKESFFPLNEPFGEYPIEWPQESPSPGDLPLFIADAAGTSPDKWAFFDCETTGLSGGVGTLAFLIAVGRPIRNGFLIRQFFLSEPADERGLLEAVEESLEGAEVLWSYNGKCFDLPLLETRFRFWRAAFDRDQYGHVDLLTPTRVLFRRRIGDCSLAGLEERILKVARVEDLPGAEVPGVYFEYLQTGRSPRLHRVFEHNRVDVLSLAVYASYLLKVFNPQHEDRLRYPEDVLSLAAYYYRRQRWEDALSCLAEACEFALGSELEAEYHRLSGYVCRRRRDYERACTHFQALVQSPAPESVDALEELAKHHEHRRRDYVEALKLTDRAINLVDRAQSFGRSYGPRRLSALQYRRARLRRKLAR